MGYTLVRDRHKATLVDTNQPFCSYKQTTRYGQHESFQIEAAIQIKPHLHSRYLLGERKSSGERGNTSSGPPFFQIKRSND